ncbi:MAG: phage tail protein [Oscillospiraceae bacterium]|nr:phage tail protein [Oscillospiraceae bacterium]
MAFTGMHLTDAGAYALAKATASTPLTLTRVAIGDGVLGTGSLIARQKLISEQMSIPIEDIRVLDNIASVIVRVTNQDLDTGFYFREMGVYCKHPDTGAEVLYTYDNCREEGEFIGDKSSANKVDFYMRLRTTFSDTDLITFPEYPNPVYILADEFEARVNALLGDMAYDPAGSAEAVRAYTDVHINDKNNPHEVTAEQTGADPAGTAETLITPVKQAITTHSINRDNPHFVTAEQVGLGNVENTADSAKSVLSAEKLTTPRTIQTNLASTAAASFDGTEGILPGVTGTLPLANGGTGQTSAQNAALALGRGYGTCSTAATIAAKVGTLSSFALITGAVVAIKFTYANTATNPTLNVNGTGAKYIYNCNTATYITSGDITAGMTAWFVYNGSQWVLLNQGSASKVARVSYVGTGYGTNNNLVTLTFPFVPQLLFITSQTNSEFAFGGRTSSSSQSIVSLMGDGKSTNSTYLWTETVQFFAVSDSMVFLNRLGITYNCTAFA